MMMSYPVQDLLLFEMNNGEMKPFLYGSVHPCSDAVESGRCRIRTHVPGSEGRKDIQTTPIAQFNPDGFPF